jgi:hypothetical protein
MKPPRTGIEAQAHGHTSTPSPRAESTRDVLDVLASGVVKTVAGGALPDPQHRGTGVTSESGRELLTEKMLADRWVCSVARLQRWRTVGEGPPYLKIVGKVLYRLKDIEAYEEASLVRKVF